jgi:AcrR family transcriptional regulator
MSSICSLKLRPRERILETARGLFRKYGVKGIGVEAIAEAAETNKMTLYRHFKSKDDLIAACLMDVAARAATVWEDLERQHAGDPVAQLHGWIRVGAECVLTEGRGCDLANAAVELPEGNHPAKKVIQDFKIAQHLKLTSLCEKAGLKDPRLAADTLSLLLEGARVNRQSIGHDGPCANYVAAAEHVVNSFLPSPMADAPGKSRASALQKAAIRTTGHR